MNWRTEIEGTSVNWRDVAGKHGTYAGVGPWSSETETVSRLSVSSLSKRNDEMT